MVNNLSAPNVTSVPKADRYKTKIAKIMENISHLYSFHLYSFVSCIDFLKNKIIEIIASNNNPAPKYAYPSYCPSVAIGKV